MNKNIKRTMAIALAVGAFSAVAPTKYVSLITTEAHASSSDADELSDLQLQTSDGDSLDIYEDSSYDDELDDEPVVGETYYAETSESKVVLNIDGADEDNVRIFKGSTEYETGDDISISSDTTTKLKVRVYEDAYDEDEDYSSSEYNQYTVIVENTDEEDNDINLSSIALSNGYINFDEDTTSYNINVAQDVRSINVTATPEEDDYTVTINGTTVDEDDDYAKAVSLSTGSNAIKIKISDDDDNTKTYTLNVNKPAQQAAVQGINMAGIPNQAGIGNNNGIANGATKGWKNDNGIWNYLDYSGNKTKGWQQIDGSWYYLDNDGKMKTGWLKDTNESWYYLQPSGAMAKNTVVDGYKIGTNGAWIK